MDRSAVRWKLQSSPLRLALSLPPLQRVHRGDRSGSEPGGQRVDQGSPIELAEHPLDGGRARRVAIRKPERALVVRGLALLPHSAITRTDNWLARIARTVRVILATSGKVMLATRRRRRRPEAGGRPPGMACLALTACGAPLRMIGALNLQIFPTGLPHDHTSSRINPAALRSSCSISRKTRYDRSTTRAFRAVRTLSPARDRGH